MENFNDFSQIEAGINPGAPNHCSRAHTLTEISAPNKIGERTTPSPVLLRNPLNNQTNNNDKDVWRRCLCESPDNSKNNTHETNRLIASEHKNPEKMEPKNSLNHNIRNTERISQI